ncbi:MAG: helix-turn-helix transcriptional regulator [Phenylobacterium sp.]|uniref:helix-turn-helix transcriptional regulator n=1 Tax=Phenylobacterium sp. TaxID=1871053 RepID=UPI0025D9DF6D|nr:helix-turn-helix transcriptional regulator [Phenylobacterium sp.]MBI1196907.1 helix-turn-helix transcriptional regulator [Phenylobacterium sp.]
MSRIDTGSLFEMSDLIGRIYDCALDPGLWPDVLDHIGQRLGFQQVTLTLQAMPGGAVMLSVASGIPEPWFERSKAYGADVIALWGGGARIAATPLEEPILLSEMNPRLRDGDVRNAFYTEWFLPQELIDTAAVGLIRDANALASISLTRHRDQGPIGLSETDAIRLLAPHLRRAVTISRLLDARTVAAATFEAVLDRTSTPTLVTDAQLGLIHADQAARALLDARDPLVLNGGRLATNLPSATRALALAVAQAAEDEAQIGRRGLGIPLRAENGEPYVLHVLPLRGGALRPGLVNRAAAAIFVSTGRPSAAESGMLAAQLFDLSAGEARIFDLIAEGLTPSGAAERLGIEVSTVRTHLVRIYAKTGAHRQSDLVRLAASLALPAG